MRLLALLVAILIALASDVAPPCAAFGECCPRNMSCGCTFGRVQCCDGSVSPCRC